MRPGAAVTPSPARTKRPARRRRERGRVVAARELVIPQDVDGQLRCRRHSLELEFCQRPLATAERGLPVLRPHDHLGHEGVVVRRDHVAVDDVRVHPDPRPSGGRNRVTVPGAGRKSWVGSSALIRSSIAWPRSSAPSLGAEAVAGRDLQLAVREVDAGEQLGDGVLDLEPGVHLDEVEAALGVEQELDRSGPAIVERFCQPAGRILHPGRISSVTAGDRPRDELLVASLDGAVALAEREHAPFAVTSTWISTWRAPTMARST